MLLVERQRNYNAGIVSPRIIGQDDLTQLQSALGDCLNCIATKYGPVEKRSGFQYIREVKDSSKYTILIPFVFSTTQVLLLEFGNLYMRVHTFDQNGFGTVPSVADPLIPYELVTPFLEADLATLSITQSFDIVYISHMNYKTQRLARTANNNWAIADYEFLDGPYEDQNTNITKLMAVTATAIGDTNLTASGAGHAPFVATDVGRHVRILNGSTWGWGVIKTFTSSTVVVLTVKSVFGATTAVSTWRMGLWSGTTDYPKCNTIHQQRLWFAGGKKNKQTVVGSMIGDYTKFSPSDYANVIADNNGVKFDIAASDKMRDIIWLKSIKALMIGTDANETRLYSAGPVLTPSDRVALIESSYGSVDTNPIVTDDSALMFIQYLNRKLRAISYDYASDQYAGPDMTLLAEQLTLGGIKQLAYQQEPNNVIWALKTDGTLLGLTYDKDQKVFAWHRHQIGGTNVKVISITSIPSPLHKQYMLFAVIERTINGAAKKYIEMMAPTFTSDVLQEDAVFLDSSITYDDVATSTITGLNHLEGQTVHVIDQGATTDPKTVVSGAITLDYPVTKAVIGLPYDAYIETLDREIQDPKISYELSKTRVVKVSARVYRTLGISIKHISDNTDEYDIPIRDFSDNMDSVPPLYTGILQETISTQWDAGLKLKITSAVGLPFTLLAHKMLIEVNANG